MRLVKDLSDLESEYIPRKFRQQSKAEEQKQASEKREEPIDNEQKEKEKEKKEGKD